MKTTILLVLAATAGPFANRGAAQTDSQPSLTGNWSGLRTALGRSGIAFAGSYTTDWSGVASGGVRRDALGRGLVNLAVSADLGALIGLRGGSVYVQFMARHGRDGGDFVGDIEATSSIDAETFHRVGEAWVEQSLAAGRVRLKVGRVDANTEFDGLPEAGAFLNASAGFSPTILFLPTYPAPMLSANLFVNPAPWLTVGAGVYDDDFGTGWNSGDGRRAVFGIGETRAAWPAGSVGVGLWRKAGTVDRRDGTAGRGTMGWFAHGAQRLWSGARSGAGESGPDLTLFAQYGAADERVSDICRHVSVGLVATGVLGGGPEHAAGVRFSRAGLSGYGLEPYAGDEINWELFVKFPATPFLTLTPDLQYVVRPSGSPTVRNALVLSVRAALQL